MNRSVKKKKKKEGVEAKGKKYALSAALNHICFYRRFYDLQIRIRAFRFGELSI